MSEKILGLVRSKHDHRLWQTFSDQRTALHAEIEDVIFGDSLAECVGQLELRFPASDPRLTRVSETHDRLYNGSRTTTVHGAVVRPLDEQRYDGKDPLEALALVKELGQVTCNGLSRTPYYGPVVDWQKEGVVVESDWSSIIRLRYNPKGVARAVKAAATRAQKRPVQCGDVSGCTWALRNLVRKHVASLEYQSKDGRYSRHSVSWFFLETIKYHVFIFGPHMYRRHPAFRKLKELWKARAKQSRKAFYGAEDQHHNSICRQFANFMDSEIRVRNGRLITKEEDWKPRTAFPTFDEYIPGNYERTCKAREKAERAKARAKRKVARVKQGSA